MQWQSVAVPYESTVAVPYDSTVAVPYVSTVAVPYDRVCWCAAKETEPQSVAVLYEHRAAPKELERGKVIDAVIEHVPRPPHTVKLKGASKTISVQVCYKHSTLNLSVAPLILVSHPICPSN